MADSNNLLYILERPRETLFVPKSQNNVYFQLPMNFHDARFQSLAPEIEKRFANMARSVVKVQEVHVPDISAVTRLERTQNFTLLLRSHAEMASILIDIFMGARDTNELLSFACFARDRINSQLFFYALSVAILHRSDTKNMVIPHFAEVFPSKFANADSLSNAVKELFVIPEGFRQPYIIRRPDVLDGDIESRLWYFREDLGANLHHWHWHLVYPSEARNMAMVRKDRRGELFYYMHQQIIARYNFERFGNNLPRVEAFRDYRGPLSAYYPDLDASTTQMRYVGRPIIQTMSDVNRTRDNISITVAQLENWRDLITDAIDKGFVISPNGQRIVLDNERGIDILGDLIESSILSPNRTLYGDLHNNLHVIISYQHDPEGTFGEGVGVIGDLSTSLRDPMFYRIHAHVDELFTMHKVKLPPYTEQQLTFHGIRVDEFEVQTNDGKINQFHTFFQQSDVNMSKGLDFQSDKGSVFTRFTHLQHNPFTYNILVTNNSNVSCNGLVRIYIAPKFDEWGKNMWFNVQRRFFIELDKFVVVLKPGDNILRRRSTASTVTIPYERTFRNLDGAGNAAFDFCGCGWPHHLLIPRGSEQGQHAELFVMVSNYDEDRVDQNFDSDTCNDAASYCGIRDRRYPDRKPMGFPFDRQARDGVTILKQFVTPNMYVQDVNIFHTDVTVQSTRPI